MPAYLVERYIPRAQAAQLAEITAAANGAARRTVGTAGAIHSLGVILVPGDELCYCLFQAPSIEAVRKAHESAQIPCERIVEAFHTTALSLCSGGAP